METVSIFISHAHEDADLAREIAVIINRISGDQIRPWTSSDSGDAGGIDVGEFWTDTIRKNLEQAKGIITLLTSKSGLKPWIYFESGFCAARDGIVVIPIAVGADFKIPQSPLSMYNIHKFSDRDSIRGFLRKVLTKFKIRFDESIVDLVLDQHMASLTDAMRNSMRQSPVDIKEYERLLDRLKRDNLPHVADFSGLQLHLVNKIVEATLKEIKEAKSNQYTVNISANKNFLIRAASLFEAASEIYAISIDRYSTFWLAEPEMSYQYIDLQSGGNTTIHRLFVFENPRSAHWHRDVMRGHYELYGKKGGVYLCSWSSYQSFLTKAFGDLSPEEYNRSQFEKGDWGLLRMRSDEWVYARLTDSHYYHELVQFNHSEGELSQKTFEKLKHALSQLKHRESNLLYDDTSGIHQWHPNFRNKRATDKWKNALERVFKSINREEEDDIYHLVFFNVKHEDSELPQLIAEARESLREIADPTGTQTIETVWFGKHTQQLKERIFRDHTGNQLITETEIVAKYPYVLVIKIRSLIDLEKYYADENHAHIRNNVYEKLTHGEEAKNILADMKKSKDKQILEKLRKAFERVGAQAIVRADYMRDEDIPHLVKTDPPTWKK